MFLKILHKLILLEYSSTFSIKKIRTILVNSKSYMIKRGGFAIVTMKVLEGGRTGKLENDDLGMKPVIDNLI